WIKTDKSFIFKIDEDQINNSILSRVQTPECAIWHNKQKINITIDDINFHEITTNFGGVLLRVHSSTNNDPYCYYDYPVAQSNRYKHCLNLRIKSRKIHLIEDYKIVRKN